MKTHKTLGLLLAATVLAGTVGLAHADTYQRTINLVNNDVQVMPIQGVDVGDDVKLMLRNQSNQELTFQTTQQLGDESSFVVAPNQSREVEFMYNRPFKEAVKYVVYNTNGDTISQNVLINIDSENEMGMDIFHQNISLRPGEIDFELDEVGKGEAVVLHLSNASGQDLMVDIEDVNNLSHDQRLVKAHTTRNIAFEYPHYFGDEIELDVSVASPSTANASTTTITTKPMTTRQMADATPTLRTTTSTDTGITAVTDVPPATYKTNVRDMTGWNGNLPYSDLAEYYEDEEQEAAVQSQSLTTVQQYSGSKSMTQTSPQASVPVNDMTGWNGNAPQQHLTYNHSVIQQGSMPAAQ